MIRQIKTSTGFECEIDDTKLDDMELFEDIVELENGNALVLPRVMTRVLGNDVKKALYEHLRGDDGRVPTQKATEALTEIMQILGKK